MVYLARQSKHLSGLSILQPSGISGMKPMAYSHACNKVLYVQATKEMDPAFLWA